MAKKLNYAAIGRQVIIKADPVKKKTDGGIALAETPRNSAGHEAGVIGTVLDVGPLAFFEDGLSEAAHKEMRRALIGKRVLFKGYLTVELESGESPVVAVEDKHVLCTL